MAIIKDIQAREISDSRGNPTVEVDLWLDDGRWYGPRYLQVLPQEKRRRWSCVTTIPSGFNGLGVLQAVANVNGPLRAFVLGQDPINQQDIDRGMIALDGTENKAKFGANAILGVSMAVLKASALAAQLPLYRYIKERYDRKRPYLMPIPFLNILNGNAHAENSPDFQEYKIAAVGAPNFREAFRWSFEVLHALKTTAPRAAPPDQQ